MITRSMLFEMYRAIRLKTPSFRFAESILQQTKEQKATNAHGKSIFFNTEEREKHETLCA